MSSAQVAIAARVAMLLGGLLLLILALSLLAQTEASMRRSHDAFGGGIQTVTSPANVHDGELVRVSGMTEVRAPAHDRQFGIVADVPVLRRTVEMVQWRELTGAGGPPAYARGWVDHAVDSSRFAQPRGHANPGAMPFHGARFQSTDVRVNGLRLTAVMIAAIPGHADYTPKLSTMPPNLAATFALRDGRLWSNRVAGSPRLGDLRVSWSTVPNRVVSDLKTKSPGKKRQV